MELISAKSGVTVTRFDFTDKSRSWRITFPSSFGRANLIQSDRNRVLSLEADTWSGASSLPGFSNTIASRRIVAGFFPAKGSVQLKVFLKTDTFTSFTVDLDINGDGKDLEQQLRVFGNGQLQFASVKPISLALTKKSWMIEFHKSSNVNAIKVSSKENIFVQEPQCALVMSAKAPAAVGPSHLYEATNVNDMDQYISTPCQFPFLIGSEEYSTCITEAALSMVSDIAIKSFYQDLVISACSATYDFNTDRKGGLCRPCSSSSSGSGGGGGGAAWADPSVQVIALSPTIRLSGTMTDLNLMLKQIVYVSSTHTDVKPSSRRERGRIDDIVTVAVWRSSDAILEANHNPPSVVDLDYGIKVISAPLIISPPAKSFVFEDLYALLPPFVLQEARFGRGVGVSRNNQLSPFDVLVNVSVSSGALSFLGLPNNEKKSQDNNALNFLNLSSTTATGAVVYSSTFGSRLSFVGKLASVNRALSSMVYQPASDRNSVVSNPKGVRSSLQRIKFITGARKEIQDITIRAAGNYPILIDDIDNSYFRLGLNCSKITSITVPEPNPVSMRIKSNAESSFVADQIRLLVLYCFGLEFKEATQGSNNPEKEVIISVSSGNNDITSATFGNNIAWRVEISLDHWALKLSDGRFPRFYVIDNQVTTIAPSIMQAALPRGVPQVTIDVQRSGDNVPSGSFRLRYGNEWTINLATNASATDVKSALEAMSSVHEVNVVREVLFNSVFEIIGYQFDFEFANNLNWGIISPTASISKTSNYYNIPRIGSSSIAFGEIESLDLDSDLVKGVGVEATVTVVDSGYVQPEVLSVVAVRLDNDELISRSTTPIYILPLRDLPMFKVNFTSISTSNETHALYKTDEDSSLNIQGLSLQSIDGVIVDSTPGLIFTLNISALFGDVNVYFSRTPSPTESTQVVYYESLRIWSIAGDLDGLNRVLSHITFTPTENFFGSAKIVLLLSDNVSGLVRPFTIIVSVFPVADALSLSVSSASYSFKCNSLVALPGITINDPDSMNFNRASNQQKLVVKVSASMGKLLVPTLRESTSRAEYIPVSWSSESAIVVSGSELMVNNVLKFLRFVGDSNSTISITASAGPRAAPTATINMIAISEHSTPTFGVEFANHGMYKIYEDSSLLFEGVKLIPLKPLTAGQQGVIEFVASCEVGSFMTSLELEADGSSSSSSGGGAVEVLSEGSVLHIRSNSVDALNRSLSRMLFTPPKEFSGSVALEASLFYAGDVYESLAMVYIEPLDDPPVIKANPPTESISSLILLSKIFGVTDHDDVRSVQVFITTGAGRLNLILNSDVLGIQSFVFDSEKSSKNTIVFSCLPSSVNEVLRYIDYFPPAHFYGEDTLRLRITSAGSPSLASIAKASSAAASSDSVHALGRATESTVVIKVDTGSALMAVCPSKIAMDEDQIVKLGFCSVIYNPQLSIHSSVIPSNLIVALSSTCGEFYISQVAELLKLEYRIISTNYTQFHSVLGNDDSSSASSFDGTMGLGLGLGLGLGTYVLDVSSADASRLLSLVNFKPKQDYNGNCSINLDLRTTFNPIMYLDASNKIDNVNSFSAELSNSTAIAVSLAAINDPPVIEAPASADVFGSWNMTSIVVSDVDISESYFGWLLVNVSSDFGSIQFAYDKISESSSSSSSSSSSLSGDYVLIDDGARSNKVQLIGTGSSITRIFATGAIVYYPVVRDEAANVDSTVKDRVAIVVSDNGFSGRNTTAGDSATAVVILAVALPRQPPSISTRMPRSSSTLSSTATTTTTTSSSSMIIPAIVGTEDVVASFGTDLFLNRGTLLSSDVVNLTFKIASSSGQFEVEKSNDLLKQISYSTDNISDITSILTMKGEIRKLNEVLELISLRPQLNVNFDLLVSVTILDASDINILSTGSIPIFLLPVNDFPRVNSEVDSITVHSSEVHISLSRFNLVLEDPDIVDKLDCSYIDVISVSIESECGALNVYRNSLLPLSYEADLFSISKDYPIYARANICSSTIPSVSNSNNNNNNNNNNSSNFYSFAPIGYRKIGISGCIRDIQNSLESLTVTHDSSSTVSTVTVTISDQGDIDSRSTGSSPLSSSKSLSINVVSDAALALNTLQLIEIDEGSSIWGSQFSFDWENFAAPSSTAAAVIAIGDVVTVEIQISSRVEIEYPTQIILKRSGDGNDDDVVISSRLNDSYVAITGPMSLVLQSLQNDLIIKPHEVFHGVLTITFSVTSGQHNDLSSTTSTTVAIDAVNRPPVVAFHGAVVTSDWSSFSTPEDTEFHIHITMSDPDLDFILFF